MIETLIMTIAAFIAANIDDVIVFAVLLAQNNDRKRFRQMMAGRYIGTFLLLAISAITVLGISLLPDWVIGLMGFVPIALGIKSIFDYRKSEEQSKDSVQEHTDMTLTYTLLTIANGADNIGVYIPLFSNFSMADAVSSAIVSALMTALFCFAVRKIAELPYIQIQIRKYQAVIVPSVLIILGIVILYRNFFI